MNKPMTLTGIYDEVFRIVRSE